MSSTARARRLRKQGTSQHTRPARTSGVTFSDPAEHYRSALRGSLLALLLFLPWLYPHRLTFPLMGQVFVFTLTLTLLVLATFYGYLRGFLTLKRTPLLFFLTCLLTTTLLATFTSVMPLRSFWGTYRYLADGLYFSLLLCALAYILHSLSLTSRHLSISINLFIAQSSFLALLTVLEAIERGGLTRIVRTITPLTNSNYFLSYALLFIPVAFWLSLRKFQLRQKGVASSYLVAGLVLLSASFFCLPPEVQTILTPWRNLSMPSPTTPTITGDVDGFLASASNNERFTQWQIAWKIGKDHPVTGLGPGTLRSAFYNYTKDLPKWDYNVAMDIPHNETLQYFATQGLVGTLAYLLLWLGSLLLLIGNWRQSNSEVRPYLGGLLLGLVLFLTFNQLTFQVPVTAVVAIAILSACFLFSPTIPSYPLRLSAIVGATFCLILIPTTYWSIRYWNAESLAGKARANGVSGVTPRILAEQAESSFPYEHTYAQLAAGYNFNDYILSYRQNNPDKQRGEEALRYIALAQKRNPYSPRLSLIAGAISYLTSPANSPEEATAYQTMILAIKRNPHDVSFYRFTRGIIQTKTDATQGTARQQEVYTLAPEHVRMALQ